MRNASDRTLSSSGSWTRQQRHRTSLTLPLGISGHSSMGQMSCTFTCRKRPVPQLCEIDRQWPSPGELPHAVSSRAPGVMHLRISSARCVGSNVPGCLVTVAGQHRAPRNATLLQQILNLLPQNSIGGDLARTFAGASVPGKPVRVKRAIPTRCGGVPSQFSAHRRCRPAHHRGDLPDPGPVLRKSAIWTRSSSERKRAEITDSRASAIGG